MTIDDYFKNEKAKYIFILLYTDVQTRMNLLNITRLHYSHRYLADEWYKKINNKLAINNAICNAQATSVLNELYHNMCKHGI